MSIELEQVKPLIVYIKVLMDSYPEPISQTELAKRSDVTKSAISKIRGKLLDFCNQRIGLFDRKLLLKDDTETINKLLILFLTDWRFKDFLQSNYAKSIVQKFNMHERLAESLKELSYVSYFSKEDTDTLVDTILINISSIKIPEEIRRHTKEFSKNKESFHSVLPFIYVFGEVTSNFDVAIFETEEELIDLLKLRDKFYAFVLDNSEAILRKWDFVKAKKAEEQETYIRVYKETIGYFLLKYMSDFTNKIQGRAKEKKIDLREEYVKVGALWKKGTR